MNEAETRAELIDPKLKASGWGLVDGTKVLREYKITAGKIQPGGGRAKPLIADYVLVYQGRKPAVQNSGVVQDKHTCGGGSQQGKIESEQSKIKSQQMKFKSQHLKIDATQHKTEVK
jgi:type I restriction enzyme R subunit